MNPIEIFETLYKRLYSFHSFLKTRQAVISFSGGKDSLVLFYFFNYLYMNKKIPQPVVFHLNHRIRDTGEETEGIRNFVEKFGFVYIYREKNIPALSQRIGKSWEETGRIFRYKTLDKVIKTLDKNPDYKSYIATGHHSKDYMESIWIHWIRGGGKKALSTLPLWNGKRLCPLVLLDEKEINNLYNEYNSQVWEDITNSDTRFLRNRIRKNLMEFLEKENFSFSGFYSMFHDIADIQPNDSISHVETNPVDNLKIHISAIKSLDSVSRAKNLLDAYAELLGLRPIRRTVVREVFPHLFRNKPYEFYSQEIYFYFHPQEGLYVLPGNSALFEEPIIQKEDSGIKITWSRKTVELAMDGSHFLTVEPPQAGEKIRDKGVRKEISELLRLRRIPPRIRKNFPILRKKGEPIKILFEFWES